MPLGLCLLSVFAILAAVDGAPHIIFILMDDVGFADINNPTSIPTPVFDSLTEKDAIKFNWHYSHPTCTPSRAALLSGRYSANVALPFAMMLGSPVGLPLDVPTLPQLLKREAGYSTHMVGKWHLGNARFSQLPISRGFDSWTGSFNWGLDAWTKMVHLTPKVSLGIDWMRATSDRNFTHFAEPRHATDAVTEEGMRIINSHAEGKVNPLFLYLAYHAGHGPLLPHPRHTAGCQHLTNEWRRDYCGLIVGLDEAVGRITSHAREVLGDDVVVVISSDNGASTWEGGLNYPLRSGKFSPFEGGVRVPAFAIDFSKDGRYFGPGGRQYEGLAHLADWMPTLLSIADVSLESLEVVTDGLDLSAALRSNAVNGSMDGPRTTVLMELFQEGECMMGPNVHAVAYRKGDYKLMEGIFQDLNYYYESHNSYLNTTDGGSLFTRFVEFLITHTEWMYGKGPFDTVRGVFSIAFLQGHYIKEQGKGDTYLFNLKDDPTETKNIATLRPDIVAELRRDVAEIKSKLPPQQAYWLVIPEEQYLASRVPGDCSMNPNIPPRECLFQHPYIADDIADSDIHLIDDTVPLVKRIAVELFLYPLFLNVAPIAVLYYAMKLFLF